MSEKRAPEVVEVPEASHDPEDEVPPPPYEYESVNDIVSETAAVRGMNYIS